MNKNYLDKFTLKNKKAYVFGGCGLIGKEITEILIAAGAKTYVFDNNYIAGKELKKKFNKSNLTYKKNKEICSKI